MEIRRLEKTVKSMRKVMRERGNGGKERRKVDKKRAGRGGTVIKVKHDNRRQRKRKVWREGEMV